jgi:hypothetical protein
MKRSKRVAVVLLSCLQFVAPTIARGDFPRAELPARTPLPPGPSVANTVLVERPREKTLSLSEFTDAFHNPKITYNDVTGEVSFSGTTSESCMDHFSFSRGEASTEIAVTFRYMSDTDRTHCLDKEQIKCEKESCVGLRTKEGSKIKLGKESGEIRMVFKDLYNQDELSSNPISKDGKNIYHKGELEIAKEKAEAADKAKAEKIAASQKALNACCTKTEQGFQEKRSILEDLFAIEAVTEDEREKLEKKINLEEMNRLKADIKKARLGSAEGETSELELLKERVAALMDTGDEALVKEGKKALADIVGRKLKDVTVDPAQAAENAIEELAELKNSGFDFSDAELRDLQQVENNLLIRKNCLTVAFNSAACQPVIQAVISERSIAQPKIGADGKILNPAKNGIQNPAEPGFQNAQPATAMNTNVPPANRVAIPSNQTIFGQFGVPAGFPAFTPNANPTTNFGIITSGYQLNNSLPQNNPAPGNFIAQ